jgi:hypothetical protein
MPRNTSGVYSLPPANPVVPYTTIATSWANPTMADIGQALTDSLDRTGRGGMLAPFRVFDGSINAPGFAFTNEPTLGIWRSGTGQMELVNTGKNILSVYADRAVSPIKLEHRGQDTYKSTGAKSWRVYNSGGAYTWTPSVTIDAEDWDTKNIFFGADGSINGINLNISGTAALGAVGLGALTATSAVVNPGNVTVSGGGQILSIGSTGTVAAAAGATQLKTEVRSAGAAGDAAMMAFHRAGVFAAAFGIDTDNQLKYGGWSLGANAYKILHEANSFSLATPGQAISALAVVGTAVMGKQSVLGTINQALDFRLFQTYYCNVGSTVTALTMNPGQIGRIEVVGNGAITISQASIHWAAGSPVWGTVVTIISIYFDGSNYFLTTTPFNS